jgi:ABC-type cobalamin transport system ATPase subunit
MCYGTLTREPSIQSSELEQKAMSAKLNFPKIRRVQLRNFTLYNLQPNVDLDLSPGVFCLAGANGLGKSTFLAAVNFAITGIVSDPTREFKSVKEYSDYGFSSAFFTGRISEEDREAASIGVSLHIGDTIFDLTRGVFEPDQLRELVITNKLSGEVLFNGSSLQDDDSGISRLKEYEHQVTKSIGLEAFEQFVFLQHFLFTFDESRRLLLWDKRVLTPVLYLSFGADYIKAQLADKIRRDMEKADSRARNRNYAASNVRSRIEMLRDLIENKTSDDLDLGALKLRHEQLTDELAGLQKEVEDRRDQINDAQLHWLEASSELATLQAEYSRTFSMRIQARSRIELHPLVAISISEARCALCGTSNSHVKDHIESKINIGHCPLCEEPIITSTAKDDSLAILKRIDASIVKAKKRLASTLKTKDRLDAELQMSELKFTTKQSELQQFESENDSALALMASSDSGLMATLKKLQDEMSELLGQKKEEYSRRDEKHRELLKLQRELQASYLEAEEVFVPSFRRLAHLFLGIDLEVSLSVSNSTSSPGLSLTLEVRGETRRETYQLSESQRFFLDIALRMALTHYMSNDKSRACLLIDTPEGSLDIAYESRAGDMFAEFADSGHDIIMTANINSSQLLLKLAERCGREKMEVYRMTSWSELSEVQLSGEALFHQAYSHIEQALNGQSN